MNHSSIIKAPNLKDESVLCLQKTDSLANNLFWGFLLQAACRKNNLFGPISLVEFMKIAKDKTFYFNRYKIEFWQQKGDSQRAYISVVYCLYAKVRKNCTENQWHHILWSPNLKFLAKTIISMYEGGHESSTTVSLYSLELNFTQWCCGSFQNWWNYKWRKVS